MEPVESDQRGFVTCQLILAYAGKVDEAYKPRPQEREEGSRRSRLLVSVARLCSIKSDKASGILCLRKPGFVFADAPSSAIRPISAISAICREQTGFRVILRPP